MNLIDARHGDSREIVASFEPETFDAVVCDPPYGLVSITKRFGAAGAAKAKGGVYARASAGFMGQKWDTGETAFNPEFWGLVWDAMKPGAHLVAFGGPRTYHRLACAIEDAGFEIRDMLQWLFGSGFPKSHAHDGGQGTALKPAQEPICLARRPLSEDTIAANIAHWGTGALNIDACRIVVDADDVRSGGFGSGLRPFVQGDVGGNTKHVGAELGRWPANVITDGSGEVLAMLPDDAGAFAPIKGNEPSRTFSGVYAGPNDQRAPTSLHDGKGSAARFWQSCAAGAEELLFWRANAILELWNPELANTVDVTSALSKGAVDFALSAVLTWAFHATPSPSRGLSTSATPSELRRLLIGSIMMILSSESVHSLALLPERLFPNGCHASTKAAPAGPKDTTTITISRWKSDGSASPIIFDITPNEAMGGERDARLFYNAKADEEERWGSRHPTVKPVSLMRWLCRLVTPPGGLVLDPFAGSGTTGIAAQAEGLRSVLIEREASYFADIQRRIEYTQGAAEHSSNALARRREQKPFTFGED